jgi:hypothetical protein
MTRRMDDEVRESPKQACTQTTALRNQVHRELHRVAQTEQLTAGK